jgi:hypothetical protein
MKMMSRLVLVGVAFAGLACGGTASEPGKAAAPNKVATVEAFAGSWAATNPSYEFIRLSVVSLSSAQGALGARLTLSGLAFDGGARIDADSLIATMSAPGSTRTDATLIARARDAKTLVTQFRTFDCSPITLTYVRQ